MIWTDKTDRILRDLWRDNTPAKKIGELLGVSTGAVKARRVRIGLPPRKMMRGVKPKPRAPKLKHLPLVLLTASQCRYATTKESPHRFCGAQVQPGSAYCAYHHDRCKRQSD